MPRMIGSRAFLVAQFLNVARGLPKQKHVIDLLKICVKLSEIPLSNCATGLRVTSRPYFGYVFYDIKKNPLARKLVGDLNQILGSRLYRGRRAVGLTQLVAPGKRPGWEHTWAPLRLIPFSKRERGTTIEKTYAIEILLDLLAEGELWRLQQCSSCGLWYAVHQKRQKACPSCAPKERLRRYMAGKGKKRREEKRQQNKAREDADKLNRAEAVLRKLKGKRARLHWKDAVCKEHPDISKKWLTAAGIGDENRGKKRTR
jgi:hypothetical protein